MTTCDNVSNLSSSQVTRVKLLGMGIVCGLDVFRDSQCFISISKGVGITSLGHVICIADKTVKYYKEYTDPNNYFNTLINCTPGAAKNCAVYELLEHREDGATSIVPQNLAAVEKPFLDDKVVLLYLEDEVKMTVRILLIDEQDMWAILKCGCIMDTYCIQTEPKEDEDISIFDKEKENALPGDEELYNAVHKKYMLNALTIRRFGYGSVDIGDLNVGDSKEENVLPNFDFTDVTADKRKEKFFKEYELIIDEALKNLDDEIDKLHNYFGCMIDACHCKDKHIDEQIKSPCNPVNAGTQTETGLQMHNIKIFNNYFIFINKKWAVYKKNRKPVESIQYFYDFVKDLIDTYNELLSELYELVNDCCAGTECFPRHLMLGRIKEEVSFQPSIFRQQYLQPPVYNGNANRLQQIRFLHWRMVIMMKCFYVPDWELDDFSDESYYDVLQIEGEKKLGQDPKLPIRITPGRMFNELLGKQTIPFYYNLSSSPYSLQYYWDYLSTKHNREDHQLSFFNKEIPGYTNIDFVVHPFIYSLSQYPFYRIEGHTGVNVSEAVAVIKNLRRRYALSFDVLPVTVNNFKELFTQPFDSKEFAAYGLEHVCGVQKGYTLLLLHDGDNVNSGAVIADFQIPFMVVSKLNETASPPPPLPPPPPADDKERIREQWKKIIEKIGAVKTAPDALQKINGLDAKMEKSIIAIGINSYLQLSKLTAADIPVMAAMLNVDKATIDVKWFAEAAELAKGTGGTSIRDKIGIAEGKDDLKKIKGIGTSVEDELNKIGITTYKQLAQLGKEDIADVAKEMGRLPHTIKEEWFAEAKTLIKK
jgi:predicted flap endonuclease-1-like 5' DNA nuclease